VSLLYDCNHQPSHVVVVEFLEVVHIGDVLDCRLKAADIAVAVLTPPNSVVVGVVLSCASDYDVVITGDSEVPSPGDVAGYGLGGGGGVGGGCGGCDVGGSRSGVSGDGSGGGGGDGWGGCGGVRGGAGGNRSGISGSRNGIGGGGGVSGSSGGVLASEGAEYEIVGIVYNTWVAKAIVAWPVDDVLCSTL
jgi:hypothetical protein